MKCQNRVGLVLFHPLWIGKFIRYKYVLSSSVLQAVGENLKVSLELSRVIRLSCAVVVQGVEWSELWVSEWVKPTCTSEGCERLSLWTDWHILVCRNHTKPGQGGFIISGSVLKGIQVGKLLTGFPKSHPSLLWCHWSFTERQNRCNYLLICFCFIKVLDQDLVLWNRSISAGFHPGVSSNKVQGPEPQPWVFSPGQSWGRRAVCGTGSVQAALAPSLPVPATSSRPGNDHRWTQRSSRRWILNAILWRGILVTTWMNQRDSLLYLYKFSLSNTNCTENFMKKLSA